MSNLKFDFSGQTVVVTGGTRGIGAAISERFLRAGAKVVATYAGNDEAALAFQDSMGELSGNFKVKKFDVSSPDQVDMFFYTLEEEEKQDVDILVNNAGLRKDHLGASMNADDWKRVIDVNLTGSFLMGQRAVKHMMKRRFGRIINISSIGGEIGIPGQANYAASKAGQIGFSKVLAKEVAKRGITVNNVLPGFIETELLEGLDEEQVKEYKKEVPLKRFGDPEEVANTVCFLASKEAGYITGSNVNITGGLA